MSTLELRTTLHRLIDGVTDNSVLEAVYALLSSSKNETSADWYETLSEDSKSSIRRGLEDIKNGKITSHEDALARFENKITNLK